MPFFLAGFSYILSDSFDVENFYLFILKLHLHYALFRLLLELRIFALALGRGNSVLVERHLFVEEVVSGDRSLSILKLVVQFKHDLVR
jgi:hypothetical protein